jgi:hypothetical protein
MLFDSIRLAQKKAAKIAGAHPKVRFEKDPEIFIMNPYERCVVHEMNPPKELVELWMSRWKRQHGFRFKDKTGAIRSIVIKSECNGIGYSCWLSTNNDQMKLVE